MKERVFKVVSEVMNIPVSQVNEKTSTDTVGQWESLKHMNLILALEEEFGVEFDDKQIGEMLSVSLIIEALQEMNEKVIN
ncbi:acyl carrier protein [Rivularia sp. UHCC 0363]|uniref:acyl carrier protein n=1 Tax=Rivularia sp. UHCC 0363 TaxID=3110244 RepID=UPI002B21112D|nr:acyl carrier protein [Rivularia sp. UHCC 0363]MEA5598794.1 acyl carrier protein [Rivularia sp. UHCC 0363]